jgi:transposase
MTVREIAEEIGIGKSVVHRMKRRIDREAKEAAADQDEANSYDWDRIGRESGATGRQRDRVLDPGG